MDVNNITEIKTGKSVWTSPYVITMVLGLGIFMTTLDVFVFSPALSVIVNNLHTSYDLVTWAVTDIYAVHDGNNAHWWKICRHIRS